MAAAAGLTAGASPFMATRSAAPDGRAAACRAPGDPPNPKLFQPQEVRLMDFAWILLVVFGWAIAMVFVMALVQMLPRDDESDEDRR